MSDWIDWNGGECPVPGDTLVDVALRDEVTERREARELYWDYQIPRCDQIIAYRIISPLGEESGS